MRVSITSLPVITGNETSPQQGRTMKMGGQYRRREEQYRIGRDMQSPFGLPTKPDDSRRTSVLYM